MIFNFVYIVEAGRPGKKEGPQFYPPQRANPNNPKDQKKK